MSWLRYIHISKLFMYKIKIIFLSISLNIRFGCSKEPSYRDGSFEYPQHIIGFGFKVLFKIISSSNYREVSIKIYNPPK